MRRVARLDAKPSVILWAGLAATAAYVSTFSAIADRLSPEVWGALIVFPAIYALSLPILAREAARHPAARRVFSLLVLALTLKLAGSMLRYFVAFDVYGGAADAGRYHNTGTEIADLIGAGDLSVFTGPLIGTNFISLITGIMYAVVGPSILSGYLLFSWLGFWGLFFFYRAFCVAVPDGASRGYGFLLFSLPTLVFWPSGIGKEAWMVFCLGIAAYGAALLYRGKAWQGLVGLALGAGSAAMVRPHLGGMVAVAAAIGFLFRPAQRELGHIAPLAKLAYLAALLGICGVLIGRADEFLRESVGAESAITSAESVRSVAAEVSDRSSKGGSEFGPVSILQYPRNAPLGAATVLFRPFIFEAHNLQALLSAIEGSFMIGFTLLRLRWGLETLRRIRTQPYLAFALIFVIAFIVAFSTIGNFGILVRERAQVYPLYLALLCLPPRRREQTTK